MIVNVGMYFIHGTSQRYNLLKLRTSSFALTFVHYTWIFVSTNHNTALKLKFKSCDVIG